MSTVLLTGGMGYIGSHTAVVLSEAGHEVVLYDNLCNSKASVLDRLETIIGKRFSFVEGDVRDVAKLEETLKAYHIDAVIHFAGLKAAESQESAQAVCAIDWRQEFVAGAHPIWTASGSIASVGSPR